MALRVFSRFIHVVAHIRISFLFRLNNVHCTYISCHYVFLNFSQLYFLKKIILNVFHVSSVSLGSSDQFDFSFRDRSYIINNMYIQLRPWANEPSTLIQLLFVEHVLCARCWAHLIARMQFLMQFLGPVCEVGTVIFLEVGKLRAGEVVQGRTANNWCGLDLKQVGEAPDRICWLSCHIISIWKNNHRTSFK